MQANNQARTTATTQSVITEILIKDANCIHSYLERMGCHELGPYEKTIKETVNLIKFSSPDNFYEISKGILWLLTADMAA